MDAAIGGGKKGFGAFARAEGHHRPGRHQRHGLALPADGLPHQKLGNALTGGTRVLLGKQSQSEREVAAAEIAHRRMLVHLGCQERGHLLKRRLRRQKATAAPQIVQPTHMQHEQRAGQTGCLALGGDAGKLPLETAPMQHRHRRVAVGLLGQPFLVPPRLLQFAAQAFHFLDQTCDRGLQRRRDAARRQAENQGIVGDRVMNRLARLGPRRQMGQAAPRPAAALFAGAGTLIPHDRYDSDLVHHRSTWVGSALVWTLGWESKNIPNHRQGFRYGHGIRREAVNVINLGIVAALGAALLFGASTPAAKLVLAGTDPWLLAGLLYLASGTGLAVVRMARPRPAVSLTGREWGWLAAAIVAGGGAAPVLLMYGLSQVGGGTASLLLTAESALTALLAWFAFGENVDRRVALGMAAIVSGAVVLTWPEKTGRASLPGCLAILGACLCWAIDNNLTRKVSLTDPLRIAALKGLAAGAVNTALALALSAAVPPPAVIGAAAVIGFFGYGVSLVLFVVALRELGAARTGAYFATAPFVGALLAVPLLGETVTPRLGAAGLLMAVGVWLHISERHEHEHVHEAAEHEHPHTHGSDGDPHHQHRHAAPVSGEHTHRHRHAALAHRHPHYPDAHHRHEH